MTNLLIPNIAKKVNAKVNNGGGWLTGISEELVSNSDIDLFMCAPSNITKKSIEGKIDNINYYVFSDKYIKSNNYNFKLEEEFILLLKRVKPDIVHIFGTEYIHSFSMLNACASVGLIDVTLISIQGLVSVYKKHYFSSLPIRVIQDYTIRDFIKNDNIKKQFIKFKSRGEYEIKAISIAKNIIGRTTWDFAYVSQINPNAKYFFCNETLRRPFYNKRWEINNCIRYSIFVSQANYPIKGFHHLLEAMPAVLKKFPNSHIYVAGENQLKPSNVLKNLKSNSYQKYIRKLIKDLSLENNVTFLGSLNDSEMCERFLKSNIFVLPSSIENSPNSLGEAMILGVPSVASYVGGVPDMLTNNTDGFLYQYNEIHMLSYFICKIFENDNLAREISENARMHAMKTHDSKKNLESLLNIYVEVFNRGH